MRYVKRNKIYTIEEIRQKNPNKSIPADADCIELGYEFLEETPVPIQEGFYAVEVAPVNNKQTWELKEIEVVVPESLTPAQIRLQLNKSGLRQEVETMVAKSDDYDLKDWWEYSTEYRRDNKILIAFAAQLGLNDEQIDKLFIEAHTLKL